MSHNDDQNKPNGLNPEIANADSQNESRRKAVKNILAGSGIAVGAATSGKWVKPAVDAVVTPAHAQTSTVLVLRGSASLTIPKAQAQVQPSRSVLDLFMDSANATIAMPSLDGACVTLTLDFVAGTASMLIEYFNAPSVTVPGTISGSTLMGSGSGITYTGTANQQAGTASGTVSNGLTSYSFSVSDAIVNCTPTAPRDTTTTYMPTTYPTTYYTTTTTYFTTTTTSTYFTTTTTPMMTTPGPTTPST